jgi:hypothetical protein
MSEFPLIAWVFLGALVTIQATWIFRDARLRGESYAWLWGLFGLINVPSSLVVYILVTRRGNIRCIQCGKSIPRESHVCPYCRKENK